MTRAALEIDAMKSLHCPRRCGHVVLAVPTAGAIAAAAEYLEHGHACLRRDEGPGPSEEEAGAEVVATAAGEVAI